MKRGRILSMVMTLLMVISMLPATVFASASPAGELGGKLKVKGLAAVGTTLSADYTDVQPAGLTDDYVTFQWNRQNSEDPTDLTELGTEKNYTVTEQDLGYVLVLKITGIGDLGVSGSLTALTKPVAATEEEAAALLDDTGEPTEDDLGEDSGDMDDPEETLTYMAEAATDDGTGVLDFGTIYAGETAEAQYVTIYNTGTGTLNFESPTSDYFQVGDISVLGAGESAVVSVQPREGLEAGTYEEPITCTTAEGAAATFTAKVVVENAPTDDSDDSAQTYTFTAEASTDDGTGLLDFGTVTVGAVDSLPEQYVTITNTGTGTLNFTEISPECFMVQDLTVLQPEESATVWVKPRTTLTEAGEYERTITYTSVEGATASFTAKVTVEELTSADDTVTYELKSDFTELSFTDLKENYSIENMEAATVKISNTGSANGTVTLLGETKYVDVMQADTSAEGEEGVNEYLVLPKAGLTASDQPYTEELKFGVEEDPTVELTIPVSVIVTKAEPTATPEPAATPEPTATKLLKSAPKQTYTFTAEASTDDGTGLLDFGTVTVGAVDSLPEQYVTITNTGTGTLNFTEISPECFMVQDLTVLQPEESATVWVKPRTTLTEAGEYERTITYTSVEGATASFTAKVTVEEELTPADEPQGQSDDILVINNDLQTNNNQTTDPADGTVTYELKSDFTELSFTDLKENYSIENMEAATVKISNTGSANGTVTLLGEAKYVDVMQADTSAEGEEGVNEYLVLPKAGLTASDQPYTEELKFGVEEDPTVELTIPVSVTVTKAEPTATPTPEPVYSFDGTPGAIGFGSMEQGSGVPEAQTVTITNTGNQTLNFLAPYAGTENFVVSGLSQSVVEPGGTATFTVQPKEGLEVGEYSDQITVSASEGYSARISVSFQVTKPVIRLTATQRAADITGLTNGIAKTADAFGLPATVVIETTDGNREASVAWNVEGCAYDAVSTEAQTFEITGTVTLPEDVVNADNLPLTTAVSVSVNAYVPKVPDASETTITGISSDGDYNTETKITFTAIGGGMDNQSPRKGDVRYVPASWKVLESRNWDGEPYAATFRMNKGGDYTLTVAYNEQKFDGTAWARTGNQTTRQVSFHVKQVNTVTATPTPTPKADQKKAVKTGDTTTILPFVIILVVAVICIAGILIYRRKKK